MQTGEGMSDVTGYFPSLNASFNFAHTKIYLDIITLNHQ